MAADADHLMVEWLKRDTPLPIKLLPTDDR
jgi:hypothetical protein